MVVLCLPVGLKCVCRFLRALMICWERLLASFKRFDGSASEHISCCCHIRSQLLRRKCLKLLIMMDICSLLKSELEAYSPSVITMLGNCDVYDITG